MNGPAIATEDVVKHFGDVEAVRGVNLEVPAGTVFGLLGPNGAGKTTIVRMLTTILKPTSGRATVLGSRLRAKTPSACATSSASPASTPRSTRT